MPDNSPKQDRINREVLANRYGFNLAFFRHHPHLYDLFKQAVKHSWSGDEFVARLRGTRWFKETSDTARQWAVLNASDPATARQRMSQRVSNVKQMIGHLGVTGYDKTEIEQLARRSLMLGWDDSQLQAALAKGFDYNPDKAYGGVVGDTVDTVRKIAAAYLVPVSDGTLDRWSQRVIQGRATVDDYEEWARQQAKSLMPALSKQIDAGMTVRDLIDPYAQVAGKLLGVNSDSIDFTKSMWRQAVDQVDPATNQRSMMSLTDWERLLKTDQRFGYDKSADGRQQAADFITKFGQLFGTMG